MDSEGPRPTTAPALTPATATAGEQVDKVGILFVHGMGDHKRGDALRGFGEPIHTWLAAWLGRGDPQPGGTAVDARDSSFRVPPLDASEAPAYTEVVTTFWEERTRRHRQVTWHAVDGWWADEIAQPRFSRVASWGLGLAPWMIVRHFWLKGWRGFALLPALALVVLFQVVILALTLLGVVPAFRGFVIRLQLTITSAIGDVMVMIASPLQFHAMTMRIVRDLAWLRRRVGTGRPIAIVAHSQGTGVAHAALRESTEPVDLFITFGTALEKLHLARQVQRKPRRLALGSSLTTAGVIALAIAAVTWVLANPFDGRLGDAYLAARWLLGGGLLLLMARLGLWFHLGRLGGAALTAVGIAACWAGVALVGAAIEEGNERFWTVLDLRLTRIWTNAADDWHRGALVCFVVAVSVLLLREVVALRWAERDQAGMILAMPSARPADNWPGLRALVDPSSILGNFLGGGSFIAGLYCLAMASELRGEGRGTLDAADDPIVLLIVAGLALCFAAVPVPITRAAEATEADFRLAGRDDLTWHNYWATADPVPDGPLPKEPGSTYVENHHVHNEDSQLADHTTYGENAEEFVSDVVRHLTALAGWAPIRPAHAAVGERAKRRRRWRVRCLVGARWVSTVGVLLCWWILGRGGLTPIGTPLKELLDALSGLIPGVEAGEWFPQWVLGMAVVAVISVVWFRSGVFQAWRYWDKAEASYLYRYRGEPASGRVGSLVFERRFASAVFALGAVIAISAAVWSPNLLQLMREHRVLFEETTPLPAGAGFWASFWPFATPDTWPATAPWVWSWPGIVAAALAATTLLTLLIYWAADLLPFRRRGR